MSKPLLVERANILASLFLIAGLVISAIGIIGLTAKDLLNLGDWDYWFAMLGVPLFLIGIIWLWMYLARVKEFHKALLEKSEANFLKAMDETEYLAWRLPSKFEKELETKKAEFNIKKWVDPERGTPTFPVEMPFTGRRGPDRWIRRAQ